MAHRRASTCSLDLLDADAQVAARRAAAHARPGRRHPRRGGRPRHARLARRGARERRPSFPRLHARLRPTCSPTPTRRVWTITRHARGPRRADRRRRPGGARSSATARASAERLASCSADGYRVVVAADGDGSAERLHDLLLDGRPRPHRRPHRRRPTSPRPGGHIVVAPLERGVRAARGQAGGPRRGRPHRPAPRPPPAAAAQARTAPAFFEDLKPGDYVVHYQHGVGRYGGMVKRAIGGVERDYLLLEYKGGDKLYVPSDQIDAVRHYTGGEAPDAAPPRRQRLRQGQGAGRGRRCARSPRSWSCSTRSGVNAAGPRLRRRHAVAARAGGGVPVRRDARPAARRSTT